MLSVDEIADWLGQDVQDVQGESLGKLEDVYYDRSGEAQLALVKRGLFGRKHALVPLAGASVGREYVRLGYPAEQIESANSGIDAELGERIDGTVAQQLGTAFSSQLPAEDLDSANALRERRLAATEARERAERLEAEADDRARSADDAHTRAEERSSAAKDAREAARRAREEADQLGGKDLEQEGGR